MVPGGIWWELTNTTVLTVLVPDSEVAGGVTENSGLHQPRMFLLSLPRLLFFYLFSFLSSPSLWRFLAPFFW